MFPVRCYTCDTVIGQHWWSYSMGLRKGGHPDRLLTTLKQHRLCCRRMFLSHVDLTTEQVRYPCVDVAMDESGTVLFRKVKGVRESVCD